MSGDPEFERLLGELLEQRNVLMDIRDVLQQIRDRLPGSLPPPKSVAELRALDDSVRQAAADAIAGCTCAGLPPKYTYRTGCPVHDKAFAKPRRDFGPPLDERACICDPDDRPPTCQHRYAHRECWAIYRG